MNHSTASSYDQAIDKKPILFPLHRGTRPRTGQSQLFDESNPIAIGEITLGERELSGPGPYQRFLVEMLMQASASLTLPVPLSSTPHHMEIASSLRVQPDKNLAAIQLIDQWLADESGYDEEAWPILKQTIEENRLSTRKRFRG